MKKVLRGFYGEVAGKRDAFPQVSAGIPGGPWARAGEGPTGPSLKVTAAGESARLFSLWCLAGKEGSLLHCI